MHASVIQFLRTAVIRSMIADLRVLEVGSYNVNGSPREYLASLHPREYVGVDMRPQPKYVDHVVPVEFLARYFGKSSFDTVICTELLEHVEDWRAAIWNLKTVLRAGGHLVLTCRGPGFIYHPFPEDHWRFTVEQMRQILADMNLLVLVPDAPYPGVLAVARKRPRKQDVDLASIQPLHVEKP
jgi:O-antigen biosynthesis protein